jgi:hypothetical protein
MKQDVQSQTTTTIKPTRSRGERGSGTTITIDLSDQSELLAEIRKAAKADDREPSNFLRRCIVLLHSQGMLIPKEVITVTNKE